MGGTTTTVETQTPAKTLAPDQKETFSFTFKPTAAGAQTLRVLYTLSLIHIWHNRHCRGNRC